MKTDNLEELFKSLDFDVAEPVKGHEQRFEAKLKKGTKGVSGSSKSIPMLLPWLALAACLLVGAFLFGGHFDQKLQQRGELASVSSEMQETQNFYASVIKKELYELEQVKTPETEKMIQDALNQLEILEQDYNKLKTDLVHSGNDNRVIYAMITNFQKRIDLLKKVVDKVNNINVLKTTSYENNLL